jgi:protein phosphatase
VRDDSTDGTGDGRQRVDELIQEANRRVYQRQSEDASLSGMGTTMTVALLEEGHVWIGHVGDSRAYLVRDGKLEQLTEDHSLVAELVRSGRLSPEEAEDHPQRSVVTRALGTDPDVDVDTFSIEAREGDLFMICSDGLTSMVSDEGILDEISRHRDDDLRATAKALVRAANRSGGEDNITVVFFELQGDEEVAERTVTLPAPEEAEDEATLDELDAVPAVKTARRPRERKQHPVRRRVVFVTLLLLLVLIAGALGVWGLWRSHFVGAESNGHVAVYQGVPWNIAGNVHLYRTVYESPLLVAQLSRSERKKLFDHSLRSKSSALHEVRSYEEQLGK